MSEVVNYIDNQEKLVISSNMSGKTLDITKQKAKRRALKLVNLKSSLNMKNKKKRLVWESQILWDPIALYLNQIWKYKVLSIEEQNELWRRMQKWDKEAKKQLILTNLRLVVRIAMSKKYIWRGIELLDLIQEWNTGLFIAAQKFNPDEHPDNTFYTYACWWIRQRINRVINEHSKAIRLPPNIMVIVNRIKYTFIKLAQKLLREPTIEEVAQELKMDNREVENFLAISNDLLSLNFEYGEDDTILQDFIEDATNSTPEENVNTIKVKENIDKILKSLTPREEQIIRMRYWIDWWDKMSQVQVWKEFSITKQGAQQIEAKAVAKLKKNKKALEIFKELLGK